MEIYLKLFEVLFPVFLIVGLGYHLGKKNPDFDTSFITTYAGNFGTPALVIFAITAGGVTFELFSEYFASDNHQMQITRPFEIINQKTEYDVRCSVRGGGPTGQAGAMVHGISKALVMFDSNFKSTLKTEKLTTRDSRAVERKKPGRKKARRSFQFSKR